MNGTIALRGDRCLVGLAFRGLEVGLQAVDALRVRAWLCDVDLGHVETLPVVDPACFEPQAATPKRASK